MKKRCFIDDKAKWLCSVRGHDISRDRQRDQAYWPRIFAGVDHFLPVCRSLALALVQKGCEKPISVVRSPINVAHIAQDPKPRHGGKVLRLLSVGRLVEKKGLVDALDAMRILKAKGVAFQYSIIGDGELRELLVEQVRANALSDNVQFLGSLSPTETLDILQSSDILVAPSKMARDGDSEGIPNVLKEAMLIGV